MYSLRKMSMSPRNYFEIPARNREPALYQSKEAGAVGARLQDWVLRYFFDSSGGDLIREIRVSDIPNLDLISGVQIVA